jgi:16S rRNA (cytosine967-C5)-methyltransferase
MTPEARIGAAAEVLDLILAGEPAEKALTSWGRRSRFAGSKDRAAVRDHVFDALRCKRSFAVLGGGLSGRGLMIGLLRSEGRDPADVFTGQGHAPAPMTDQETAGGGTPDGADALDLPDWIVPELQVSLGDPAPVAQILRARAPVMLRVNLRKGTVPDAIRVLAKDGIVATPVGVSPTALLLSEGARRLSSSAAYLDGLVELQDGASQAVVDRLPLRDGMRVLDYCAGGGGKTLAMAGRACADFYAHDANPRRLKDLPVRAERAGITVKLLDSAALSGAGAFDLVLCDAPCSGSGAWRRSPEGKWAFDAAALQGLTQVQDEILDHAKALVAENGVLAYATCSVLQAENQSRISGFLARHPSWELQWSQQWLPGPEGDGFFAACLTKSTK